MPFGTLKRTVNHKAIKAMHPAILLCLLKIWNEEKCVVNVNNRIACPSKHCLHSHVTERRDMI